jgi:Rieske Fe-S protein
MSRNRAHPFADRPATGDAPQPDRRAVLQGAAGLVLSWLMPVASSGQEPGSGRDAARARPAEGDCLVRVNDDAHTALTAADVPTAATPIVAWPMTSDDRTIRSGSRLNRILLVRLDPSTLAARTAPLAADGVLAYSAICTHSGCDVGSWLTDEQLLHCECHESRFDPRDGARVTDGPAPRSLPALPLRVVDGRLVVAGPFTTRPGFEQG